MGRSCKRRTQEEIEKMNRSILSLAKEGLSYRQIGGMLGISYTLVWDRLKAMNFNYKEHKEARDKERINSEVIDFINTTWTSTNSRNAVIKLTKEKYDLSIMEIKNVLDNTLKTKSFCRHCGKELVDKTKRFYCGTTCKNKYRAKQDLDIIRQSEAMDDMKKDVFNGYSIEEMSKKYKLNFNTSYLVIREFKQRKRGYTVRTPEEIDNLYNVICKYVNEKKSVSFISKELNVPMGTIDNYKRRAIKNGDISVRKYTSKKSI